MNNLINDIGVFILMFMLGWMIAEYFGMKIERFHAMRKFYQQFKNKGLPDRIVNDIVNSIRPGNKE